METKNLAGEILKLLPGGDCTGRGGCGFASCEQCAKAIAEGADTNRCPACDQEALNAIAALLGREPVEAKPLTAFVRCSGSAAGKARLKVYASCEAAVKSGFTADECKYGCVGAGSCVEACTFGALTISDGKVAVDKGLCNGCGACAEACPQKLIAIVPEDASNFVPCSNQDEEERSYKLCGYSCVGCGDCAEACPEEAITIIDNHAVIDYEKCVGCAACTVACRKKIIVDTYHDLTKLKPTVAFVQCRGGWHNHEVYVNAGITSCHQAAQHDLPGHCSYGCAGFGDCAQACRFDAISIVDGTAKVDPDKCVGCQACVFTCPQHLPVIVPYKGAKMVPCASKDDPEVRKQLCWVGCIGCGDCVDNCPDGLIHLEEGKAVIAPENCEDCNICTYVCPKNVIVTREMPEYTYVQVRAMAAMKGGAAK
jgi:ferredoxin